MRQAACRGKDNARVGPARSSWGPLVIVGQARSGTSLLTRVLADTRRFALVNDAYFIQYLDGLRAWGVLDLRQKRQLADFALTQIQGRIVSHSDREIFRSIYLTPEQIQELEERTDRFVRECETGCDLVEALLNATAELSGCDVWGWKCPPDYMHVDRILAHFPRARFIFMIRNPFQTLRSYKNWPWKDGRLRYHPLIQALVWRLVIERFEKSDTDNGRISLVRFEDLVDQSAKVQAQLTGFLGHFEWPKTVDEVVPNTSLRGTRKELSRIEWRICNSVTGSYLDRLDYDAKQTDTEVLGVSDFLITSINCSWYYATAAFYSRDMRNRLKLYLATLLTRIGRLP